MSPETTSSFLFPSFLFFFISPFFFLPPLCPSYILAFLSLSSFLFLFITFILCQFIFIPYVSDASVFPVMIFFSTSSFSRSGAVCFCLIIPSQLLTDPGWLYHYELYQHDGAPWVSNLSVNDRSWWLLHYELCKNHSAPWVISSAAYVQWPKNPNLTTGVEQYYQILSCYRKKQTSSIILGLTKFLFVPTVWPMNTRMEFFLYAFDFSCVSSQCPGHFSHTQKVNTKTWISTLTQSSCALFAKWVQSHFLHIFASQVEKNHFQDEHTVTIFQQWVMCVEGC